MQSRLLSHGLASTSAASACHHAQRCSSMSLAARQPIPTAAFSKPHAIGTNTAICSSHGKSCHLQSAASGNVRTELGVQRLRMSRQMRQIRCQMAAAAISAPPAAETAPANTSDAHPASVAALVTQEHVVVNFYHLTHIDDPEQMKERHWEVLNGKGIRGRIYICGQGINAQFSGTKENAVAYAQWVEQQPEFQGLRWTVAPVEKHMFPRLRLAIRGLVSLAGGTEHLPLTDPSSRAQPLSPSAWKDMLRSARRIDPLASSAEAQASQPASTGDSGSSGSGVGNSSEAGRDGGNGAAAAPTAASSFQPQGSWRSLGGRPAAGSSGSTAGQDVVVLDVRNGYEWDAGHFQGAERPLEDTFSETPTEAGSAPLPAALEGKGPDTPVMMYCTGGIRCDIYSAYLRTKGFNNLYTLEGGVHNYFREQGGDGWNGSLFVFDNRLAVPPEESAETAGALKAAVGCQQCGGPQATLPHCNCANIDCGRLFIACDACKTKWNGCCCEDCLVNAPRLIRPALTAGGYERVSAYFDKQQLAKMASGRGEGRLRRRREWQTKLKQKKAERRARLEEQRATIKAAIAECLPSSSSSSDDESMPSTASLAERLQQLRQRRGAKRQSAEASAGA